MITEISELPVGSEITADIIIIGGGMAGITLAREWAGSSKSIAILESGGRDIDTDIQELYAGTATLSGDGNPGREINDYLMSSRARAYGGSGHWWGGKCVPLDAADFTHRPWIKDSGWPMSRADLQPFYNRACDVLSIGHFDADYTKPQHEGRPPLDINGSRHITSLPRQFTKVTGRGLSKKKFNQFRYDYAEAGNISVYLHANVVDFHLNPIGTALESLGIKTLDGKQFQARAGVYVMACGGIENARLLLAANARNNTRFGHRSDAVGRYFQGHTTISKDRTKTRSATQIHFSNPPNSLSLYADRGPKAPHAVLGTTLAGQEFDKSHAFTITMGLDKEKGAKTEQAVRTIASRVDQNGVNANNGQGCWCYFMTENLPTPDSRVSLSNDLDDLGMPRVNLSWKYGATDLDGFEKSVNGFARELGSSGLGRIACPVERNEIIELMDPSRHHMGTTRMHADPAIGVVDPDLKCHDAENLYIAGSSVFPTSGIANPTLTILALTLRLSDHLKQKLGA